MAVEIKKVTMGLTSKDIQNTDAVFNAFNVRSKASAVSTALELTSAIATELKKGSKIIIETKSGERKELHITGVELNK